MIQIIVLLEVNDKTFFQKFEKNATKVMGKYNGKLLSAFRPNEAESTFPNIDEVHILEFPDLVAFRNYREDPELKKLSGLRNKGIFKTTIIVSGKNVIY